jgi:hypothetical protein
LVQRSAAVKRLVSGLIRHEAGGSLAAESLAAAVENSFRKLSGELETLVGQDGVTALVGRALNLVKREYPFLGEVRLESHQPLVFGRLSESLQGRAEAEAVGACEAMLGNLLELLVGLLGEELGLRPVYRVWSGVLPAAAPPTSREEEA